jgi:hypothetical protein
MDARTIGQLISGFGAKVLVAGLALWCVSEAVQFIASTFGQISSAFGK